MQDQLDPARDRTASGPARNIIRILPNHVALAGERPEQGVGRLAPVTRQVGGREIHSDGGAHPGSAADPADPTISRRVCRPPLVA